MLGWTRTVGVPRSSLPHLAGRPSAELSVNAWIEPLPDGWDAEAFCALERRSDWSDLMIQDEVMGDSADGGTQGLADSPESDWPQGSGSGKWKRVAVTPCGGSARAEVFVE